MNYIEIVARQSVLETEMMERQQELQELQQLRTAESQKHEDLVTTQVLESGSQVGITLRYSDAGKNIFDLSDGESTLLFGVEDYNEISQFFSKYNDAIFSYMTEITKVEEDEGEES